MLCYCVCLLNYGQELVLCYSLTMLNTISLYNILLSHALSFLSINTLYRKIIIFCTSLHSANIGYLKHN